jgi:uncharacterized repeat protein (TIGR02543 family)
MKGIRLSSDVIIGLNWEEKDDIKVVLRIVPINIYDAADVDNTVITDGKSKTYPLPSGKFAKSALLYSEYPRGKIPGADKALIKIQFEGIPNTISKLLFIFTAVDAAGNPQSIQQLKRIPVWCATPTTAMDVIGSGGKLVEEDLAQCLVEDTAVAAPLEVVQNEDGWVINSLADGHKSFANIFSALGIAVKSECHIEFDSNGGANIASQTVPLGAAAGAPTVSMRAGYKFSGWYSDSAMQNIYDFSSAVTQDLTLYAKWEERKEEERKEQEKQKEPKMLVSGEKVEIPDDSKHITVTLATDASFRPDISAFILDGKTQPQAIAEQLIFYNQPQGANGAVTYDVTTNSLDFDLDRVPADIIRVAIVLSIDEQGKNFGQANHLTATFKTQYGVLFEYSPNIKGMPFRVVDMCHVYRYKDKWKFSANGKGINGGLEVLCAQYGVEVN